MRPPIRRASRAATTGAGGVVRHALFGFLMGSADTVPGVSGGTVAFVCGIYERLVGAIRDASVALTLLARRRFGAALAQLRLVDWNLLVPLLAGILTAVFTLASTIEHLLDAQPIRMAGLFLGLVLGSVVVSLGLLRRPPDAGTGLIVVVTAVAVFTLLGIRPETRAEEAEAVASAPLWAYPASAVIAICAMILPGVSGSFLLVTMGMYEDVLGAVNDRDVVALVLFAAGCVVGLAAFSRLLARLLATHHDRVVAAMIGLMLGSVRALWPWPGGTGTTRLAAPDGDVAAPLILAGVGFVAVVALGRLGAVKEERTARSG